jgi:hypothetical protein
MKRFTILTVLLSMAATGAAFARNDPQFASLAQSVPQTLSLPQAAPAASPPSNFAPAPVPNPDAGAPVVQAPTGPHVTPNLFTEKREYKGEGFVPGSSFSSGEANKRQFKPAPGATLKVPLY